MRLSRLLGILQRGLRKHGDMPVFFRDPERGAQPVTYAEYFTETTSVFPLHVEHVLLTDTEYGGILMDTQPVQYIVDTATRDLSPVRKSRIHIEFMDRDPDPLSTRDMIEADDYRLENNVLHIRSGGRWYNYPLVNIRTYRVERP